MGVLAGFTTGLLLGHIVRLRVMFITLAAILAFVIVALLSATSMPIVALLCVVLATNLGLFAGSLCGRDFGGG